VPVAHHSSSSGAVALHYETFGSPSAPALLLVNGLGGQCTSYHVAWCERFVARGFHVIRFDNRDVGLSSKLTGELGSYRLTDMASDAIAVLDAARVERAHALGVSMGGMIVQTLAIEHPERVRSMISVMSTTGERDVGQPSEEAKVELFASPPSDRDGYVAGKIAGLRTSTAGGRRRRRRSTGASNRRVRSASSPPSDAPAPGRTPCGGSRCPPSWSMATATR
jgi:pimeloyl-ACP methyl ester carboxylesterase